MSRKAGKAMSVKVHFKTLSSHDFTFNAAAFAPQRSEAKNICAVISHGYTSSKNSVLPWAQRLSDAGIPCVIFDLPGHFLGGLHEVDSFELFTQKAHHCFETAFHFLREFMSSDFACEKIVLAGHSLGALLALKALELEIFTKNPALAIGVGLGLSQHKNQHLFESSFYEKTLNIRRQLVSKNLDSDLVFPWIKKEKEELELVQKRIHLITGKDDVVVGEGGMSAFADQLERQGNHVTQDEPKKLPHHEPGIAAAHIYHFLKSELEL